MLLNLLCSLFDNSLCHHNIFLLQPCRTECKNTFKKEEKKKKEKPWGRWLSDTSVYLSTKGRFSHRTSLAQSLFCVSFLKSGDGRPPASTCCLICMQWCGWWGRVWPTITRITCGRCPPTWSCILCGRSRMWGTEKWIRVPVGLQHTGASQYNI